MSSGRRLVDPNLSLQAIRRHHIISSGVPASVLLLMVLVAMGMGRWVNPLLLAYLVAFAYVVVGVYEGREPISAEESGREGSPAEDGRGEAERTSG